MDVSGYYDTFNVVLHDTLLSSGSGFVSDVSGLDPNFSYTLKVYPLNSSGNTNINNNEIGTVTFHTLPVLTDINYTNDASSVTILVDGVYDYINIYRGDEYASFDTATLIAGSFSGNSYTDYMDPSVTNQNLFTYFVQPTDSTGTILGDYLSIVGSTL